MPTILGVAPRFPREAKSIFGFFPRKCNVRRPTSKLPAAKGPQTGKMPNSALAKPAWARRHLRFVACPDYIAAIDLNPLIVAGEVEVGQNPDSVAWASSKERWKPRASALGIALGWNGL